LDEGAFAGVVGSASFFVLGGLYIGTSWSDALMRFVDSLEPSRAAAP
jgi:hypothetical protein